MQILALHGFTGCGSDFAPFAELVGGQWHYPDLPGHGANSQLDCSPEATIDFIPKELLTPHTQLPTSKNILLGYSMGARAALLHACQHPEAWDALILISANPGIENEVERAQRRSADADLADSIEVKGVPAFLDLWQQTPVIRSQQNIRSDWRAAMQANRQKHTAKGLANSLRQFGQGSTPNLWPELNKLQMPLCLITGAQDSKYTKIAEKMRITLPHRNGIEADHTIIESTGHAPHLEAPEATAKVIRQFLKM